MIPADILNEWEKKGADNEHSQSGPGKKPTAVET
jgi:hypothetical protein